MRHKHLNISYLRVIYAQLLRLLEIRGNSVFGQTQSLVSVLLKVRKTSTGCPGIENIANPSQPALEPVQLEGSQKAMSLPVWQFPNGAQDGLGTVPKVLQTFLNSR